MWLAPAASTSPLDDTPPLVSYSIDGINGANGWYRASTSGNFVVVHWTVSDPDSPISSTSGCEPAIRIDDPNPGTTRTCTATSDGGTTAVTTKTIKIDADPPTGVNANAARAPDHGPWYHQPVGVGWKGNDATSGIASCTAITYSGPDTGSAAPSGTCTDVAGNVSGAVAYPLKYDSTAPSVTATPDRQANVNGWYKAAVTINWAATDAVSGVAGCTTPQTYSGPDSGGAVASGTCTDQAGNAATVAFPLKYDATTPTGVAPTAARAPDQGGWYNHAVGISWSGSDSTSGISSCTSSTYSGPDSGSAGPGGTCTDKAGNQSASVPFPLKYDATAPSVTTSPDRQPNANGWYNAAVTIDWNGSDSTSGVAGCSPDLNYSGPDSGNAAPNGTCTDNAGNVSSKSFPLKYDSAAPTSVAAASARPPDQNGWFNHAVGITWSGSDTTSGIASCTSITYSGPDDGSAAPSGSCTDKAGNASSSISFPLKYDATAPTGVSAAPGRSADKNGWYNHSVGISWNGSDATSGVGACTSVTYSGPDNGSASQPGSCTDRAGNISGTVAFAFKYDATGPVVTPTAGRVADANGWYNHPVTISWSGADSVSGLDTCSAPVTYSGPDNTGASVAAACTDMAGNPTSAAFPLKYDATAPTVAASPARAPDSNGWYNHQVAISWSGSDATSGIDTCSAPVSYAGPDGGNAAAGGTCTDKAGNAGSSTTQIKFDATPPAVSPAPSRAPDANGWYNHALTIGWTGADPASGVDSCSAQAAYNGPDDATAATSGTCTDKAGNTAPTVTFLFKFDATAPLATGATAARAPDQSGWYNHPVLTTWDGTDNLSGIAGCTSSTYNGPDGGTAAASGTCADLAGNVSAPLAFPLKFDTTPPVISATPGRATDANGWYNHAVTIGWSGSDATSGLAGCTPPLTYGGPDAASAAPSGSCTDQAGNVAALAFPLRYDATAPSVSARADRPSDHDGWYSHPLSVQFVGNDAVSGIDSCTSASYKGPAGKDHTSTGHCSDRAGNFGSGSFAFNYDDESPTLSGFAVESREGADVVSWKSSSPDDVATVSRTPRGGRPATVFRGGGAMFVDKGIKPGFEYRYSVQTADQAGNESKPLSGLALPKVLTLQSRGYVPRTAGAPVLRLPTVAGSSYYHVQLFRRGVRIYAAWPLRPQLALHSRWNWAGRSYSLTLGRYRWFAWAGFGRRSAARYKLLGSAEFVVAGRS
jgi:large repetitive protein